MPSSSNFEKTKLGARVATKKKSLEDLGTQGLFDLRQGAKNPKTLRQQGFGKQDIKVITEFSDLAKVFPPHIAIALQDAGAADVASLGQWEQSKFVAALEKAGINAAQIAYESSRLEQLKKLLSGSTSADSIDGLKVDLEPAVRFIKSEEDQLREAGIQTLSDWAALRDRVELRRETASDLDARARLSFIGVRGELATRLIKLKLTSAFDLGRLNNEELKKIAKSAKVSVYDLRVIKNRAVLWVGQVANTAMTTNTSGKWQGSSFDLHNIVPGDDGCAGCTEDLSAFSRFAYFVYLIRRTGKSLEELEPIFLQHFKTISPDSGREEILQVQICKGVLARANPAPLSFAESFIYERELLAGRMRSVPLMIEKFASEFFPANADSIASRLRQMLTASFGSFAPRFTSAEMSGIKNEVDYLVAEYFLAQVRAEAGFAGASQGQIGNETQRRILDLEESLAAGALPLLRDAFKTRTGKTDQQLFDQFFIETDLPGCERITILDQAIRSLQAYLDHAKSVAASTADAARLSYQTYEVWRADRMSAIYPELRALWRDDVLVNERSPLDRGSILYRHALNDPKIKADLQAAAAVLEDVNVKVDEQVESFRTSHAVLYADFVRGLETIKEIVDANRQVQNALAALDTDEAGLAVSHLNGAAIHFDKVAALVFKPTSKWVTLGSGIDLFDKLSRMPLAKRQQILGDLFEELTTGKKAIFIPRNADLKIGGLLANGDLEDLESWKQDENLKLFSLQDGMVHKKADGSSSGLKQLRYNKDQSKFENYVVTVDFTLPSGLGQKRVGLGARFDVTGAVGYRVVVAREVTHVDPGNDEGGEGIDWLIDGISDTVRGQDSYEVVKYSLALESFDEDESVALYGPREISSLVYNDSGIAGRELLPPGDTFTLALGVFGSTLKGKLIVGEQIYEVAADNGNFQTGTFALLASRALEVNFSNLRLSVEGADGRPPFYASRRIIRKQDISPLPYDRHKAGEAMGLRGLAPTQILFTTDDDLSVRLQDAWINGNKVWLDFKREETALDLNRLDIILERLLSMVFYLRYAVIPVRLAQAYAHAGEYERAAAMLKILYDDAGASETERKIYPHFLEAGEAFTQTVGPDARLMRLRLGDIYLAQAEWLFRKNTPESRYRARRLYQRVLALYNKADCRCEEAVGEVTELVVDRVVDSWLVTKPDERVPAHIVTAAVDHVAGDLNPDPGDLLKDLEGIMPGPPKDIMGAIDASINRTRAYISESFTIPKLITAGAEVIRTAELLAIGNLPSTMLWSRLTVASTQANLGYFDLTPGPHLIDYTFCIPEAPLKSGQKRTACQMLDLLRTCRNILGFSDDVVPPLRFNTLLQVARSFTDLAHAAERDLLNFRQQFEQETFSLLEAENNLAVSDAQMALESMNVELAQGEITLAGLQLEQANSAATHFSELLKAGLLASEQHALDYANAAVAFSAYSAALAVPGIAAAIATGSSGDVLSAGGGGISSISQMARDMSAASTMYANFERREQDWKFQLQQSLTGVSIATANLSQAAVRLGIATQTQRIAGLRRDFSAMGVQYLGNKFLNSAMWLMLQRVIREQYRRRLNYAIAASFMAEKALAFELQNRQLKVIGFDYFDPKRDGLLGATQLQTDLATLEQTRLSLTSRKHQLTKTISLARTMPAEFEVFRTGGTFGEQLSAGRLRFRTLMEQFDSDHPGHYMRLIKSVKVTVAALIPPHEGIHATLKSSGISQVVLGPPFENTFKEETVRRTPESVALSVPFQATGLFVLDYNDPMLLPFEGSGVATDWIFELPKPANHFDFRTIADVLLTIEYTALESPVYRSQVIHRLGTTASGDRPFSFRRDFPDCWYDLNHPELAQSGQQLQVNFETHRTDFPPNVNNPVIAHVTLYFVRGQGFVHPIEVESLMFTLPHGQLIGGKPTTTSGLISTREPAKCEEWQPILGKGVNGKWRLSLLPPGADQPVIDKIKGWFNKGKIEDILFVITFTGTTSEWPNS